jgi:hypothetical protein
MNLCCQGLALGARVVALARIAHPPDEAGHAVEEKKVSGGDGDVFWAFLPRHAAVWWCAVK